MRVSILFGTWTDCGGSRLWGYSDCHVGVTRLWAWTEYCGDQKIQIVGVSIFWASVLNHSNFEIFQKGDPAVEFMLDRRIFER